MPGVGVYESRILQRLGQVIRNSALGSQRLDGIGERDAQFVSQFDRQLTGADDRIELAVNLRRE